VAVIVALGLYPQFVVKRTETDVAKSIEAAQSRTQPEVSVIR
jgi:NADH:ubiquinone oxidoreductase subunit 4 (subunit M)